MTKRVDYNPETGRLLFFCPGCDCLHQVFVRTESHLCWTWNGSEDAPTLTPSVLVRGLAPMTSEQMNAYIETRVLPPVIRTACHSFVTDGQIQFLGDCTHALAGQTVPLPDVES